ncbi:hypothetical protein [Clostridium sp.]|uniref:hypothetical protein n=1 Tax=Clostridium sp. TaxID=1506 RepID=UPI00262FC22F|nr:hypothetical protein [uncultured Clostridium sp.]
MDNNEIKDMLVKILEGQTELKEGQKRLEIEAGRHSIELGAIGKNIIVVQTSHKDQHDFLSKNTDTPIEDTSDTLKIKSASEMKELTNSILEEVIEIDKIVQIELKDILSQIKVIAKIGGFSTTILFYHKNVNKEVIEKLMNILKKSGYKVNLKEFLNEHNVLEIKWD